MALTDTEIFRSETTERVYKVFDGGGLGHAGVATAAQIP